MKIPKLKLRTRSVIAGAFVLLICAAAYTDHYLVDRKAAETSASGEYIYTSSDESEHVKILGEAALVGSISTEDEPEPAEAASYDTYFSAMQVDRQRSRDEAVEMLQIVVDSADTMPDVKADAFREMMNIASNIEIESNVRSMVMAKGFDDCIAVVNGENLNVIVKTPGLLVNEVAQIKEIAVAESGFPTENIRIVEKNG